MLLSLVGPFGHQFNSHYRTPQVRRSIERHTFVAQPESDAASYIVSADKRPIAEPPALPIQAWRQRQPVDADSTALEPLRYLLGRLKLCTRGTDASGPLLQNLA